MEITAQAPVLQPFVNGNREQTNNFTVDGLDANETIDNRMAAGC